MRTGIGMRMGIYQLWVQGMRMVMRIEIKMRMSMHMRTGIWVGMGTGGCGTIGVSEPPASGDTGQTAWEVIGGLGQADG